MEIKLYCTNSCFYCHMAKKLLTERGLPFTEIDCTGDAATRAQLVEWTGRRTVPQIFIDGVPIGGFDDLHALDRAGTLAKIVAGEARPTSVAP